jgi:ABC-2 type transport system ATP-binding protein
MSAAIETTDLSKSFGDIHAVSDLNLSVEQGECYAFLGRNGSGKSTTARMLLDFIRPSKGSSRILGGSGADARVRAKVGYLPGDLDMPRAMTVQDAFDFYGGLAGAEPGSERPLIERFQLSTGRKVRELLTGNRRKVGLILAFMPNPELLILDEPTSGLDPVLQDEFRTLLAERKADGATIWLTSHVMAEVERVADRVGLIDDGHLAQEVSMDELKHQTIGSIKLTFAAPPGVDSFDGVAAATHVEAVDNDLLIQVEGPIAPLLSRAGELGAIRIETMQRDLDEVFLDLYEGASRSGSGPSRQREPEPGDSGSGEAGR